MANEQKAIQSAYEDQLKGMFDTLVTNLIVDGTKIATDRFKKGFAAAQQSRDIALSIVQDTAGKGK